MTALSVYINISFSNQTSTSNIWLLLERDTLEIMIIGTSVKLMSLVLSVLGIKQSEYVMVNFNRRTVIDVTLEKVGGLYQSVIEGDGLDLYCFVIKGNSFLWHQVAKCIMFKLIR